MRKLSALCALTFGLVIAPLAIAKLPAPPEPTPEAKAKAAEAAAKKAWADKVGAFQLCQSQDRVAAGYRARAAAAGKSLQPPPGTPACADPGPFIPVAAVDQKPIEAAGAHSPAETATSPPSTVKPAAEMGSGAPKPAAEAASSAAMPATPAPAAAMPAPAASMPAPAAAMPATEPAPPTKQ